MPDDPTLNGLLDTARQAFRADRLNECVRAYADAYLRILEVRVDVRDRLIEVLEHPAVRAGLENGSIRNAPLMWPRFGAKLHRDGEVFSISIDRKRMSFSEAIQYQEFMQALVEMLDRGDIKVDFNRIGVGM